MELPIIPLAGVDELPLAGQVTGNLIVAAALVPGARQPAGFSASGRYVSLVLGNEGFGLPDDVTAACDECIMIPMAGSVDSLNVGAAGAILMWELFRK